MIELKNIAAVVVLYNSNDDVLENINTYINQVAKLYVMDNSTSYNLSLIKQIKKIEGVSYHSLNGNQGIASALNWAAKQAIKDGFRVLLTMDDDTRTPNDMVQQMINFWNRYPEPVGIISGVHHNRLSAVPYRAILYTLTSGNLINLAAFNEIGGFRDDLFIDHVDHEYGIQLNRSGYQVVELPGIHLAHRLGYSKTVRIGSVTLFSYGTHSPIRLYYYARNGMYLSRIHFSEHPGFAYTFVKEIIKRSVKALIFDVNSRIRMRMMIKGIEHGWKGKLGKYNFGSDD